MQASSTTRRGSISFFQALLLGPLPLGFLAWFEDWYVDVNHPLCPGGIGTQNQPFCHVMDAVNAASDGDTIHIAPGTYLENVVLEKDLTLIGTGGQELTILDGMASGSVVRVGAADVSLTGLTLTNGSGTVRGFAVSGGGLFAYGVQYYYDLPRVALTSCTVTGNSVHGTGTVTATGGGVYFYGDALTITDSTVSANAVQGVYAFGGGMWAYGDQRSTLTSTTISGNTCEASGAYAYSAGGGIGGGRLTLTSSTVSDNLCASVGTIAATALGGGIHASSLIATDSTVSGNVSQRSGGSFGIDSGGGIRAGGARLTNVDVRNNTSTQLGGGIATSFLELTDSTVRDNQAENGGGLFQFYNSITIQNSSLTGNTASGGVGGGISSYGGYLTLLNSSVSGNAGGGVFKQGYYYTYYLELDLKNSILWGNGSASLVVAGSPSSTVEHSLIEGGWPGTGNIDADPLFVDPLGGDYHLLPGSPCIDAGDSLAVPAGVWGDLEGGRRFIDDPQTPDTGRGTRLLPVVDMGPHEFGSVPAKSVREAREAGRPIPRFGATPRSGAVPLMVSFTDHSASSPTGWTWDFGDGASSTLRHPTHLYTTPGTYTVTLTASNVFGPATSVKMGFIEVLAVITDFSATPRTGALPLSVSFTDLTANAPTSWSWDFGDGGSSTLQHPTHTYTSPGTFTVSLTASNALGSNTETKSAYVQTLGVVAAFEGAPRSGGLPLTVSFTDLSAHAPTSWLWDFGDGETSSVQHPTHTYASLGTFTVTLTASNAYSADAETKSGYVQGLGVVANFSAAPRSGGAPLTVSFIDLSTNAATSWSWDFGDGETSSVQHPTHVYSSPGTFTVTLTASNPYSSDAETKVGYIQALGVLADFSGSPRSGAAALSVSFTDLSANGPTSWSWDFGDGGSSSLQHPTHTYTGPGTYAVSLTASNAFGPDTETKAGYIQVSDAAGTEQARLVAGDGAAFDAFGVSVALSGDTALVGAELEDHAGGVDAGSAYVFVLGGTSWSKQAKLVASDAAALDSFGRAVALEGDTLLVSAHLDDHGGGQNAGSVYVFERSGTSWTQQAKLVASDAIARDAFGTSVALFGDTAIVGSPLDETGLVTNTGSAYVFVRDGTSWTEQAKLVGLGIGPLGNFGASVALSGDTAVVGASGQVDQDRVGSVHVFVRSGTSWALQERLGDLAEGIGVSVAVDGDTMALGAPLSPSSGATLVFVRSGTDWSQQANLGADFPLAGDGFGSSVSLEGDKLLVGASLADKLTGAAYVFARSGTSWTQQAKLGAGDPQTSASFGASVALDAGQGLVGAPANDHAAGTDAGAAYVYGPGLLGRREPGPPPPVSSISARRRP